MGFVGAGLVIALAEFAASAGLSLGLNWNASVAPYVTAYKVYYGPASGNYTNMLSVGNVTNTIVSGLSENATYFFAVTSLNLLGMEGSFSEETSYAIPTAATLAIMGIETNGVIGSVSITGTGAVPDHWALEASPDLKNWAAVARGTNVLLNVSLPTDGNPQQFFRLKAE